MSGPIALIGFIGSGKDTAANILVENYGAKKDSFASPLKDLTSAVFGWPRDLMEGDTIQSRDFRETPDVFWSRKLEIPNFTPRLALQLLGTDVLRNHFDENIWLHSFEYRYRCINDSYNFTVLSDARFKNELDLIKRMGGNVIWVQRDHLPEWYETAVKANAGNVIAKKIMNTKYRDVHQSEWNWAGYDVDYIVENNGTIEDLATKLHTIHEQICQSNLKAI